MAQLGNGIGNVQRHSALLWCSCAPLILAYPPLIQTKQPAAIHGPSCSFRGGSSSTPISYKLCYSIVLFCTSAPNVLPSSSSLLWWPLRTISQTLYPNKKGASPLESLLLGQMGLCIAASWRTWQIQCCWNAAQSFLIGLGVLSFRIWLLCCLCLN